MAAGLWQSLPTTQDTTVGGIRFVWIIPRRWVAQWHYEFTSGGRYGQIVGAEYGRRSWSILSRYPVDGKLTVREASKQANAYTYNVQLTVTVNGASLQRLDWLEALSQGQDVAMMVQLLDGQILLIGEQPGCRLTVELDSGSRGQGTKVTVSATHVTRNVPRVVPYEVAAEWVTEDLCDATLRAWCKLTLDDWCVPSIVELCPPVGPGGQALGIQLVPGPTGPPGSEGPQGPPGPNDLNLATGVLSFDLVAGGVATAPYTVVNGDVHVNPYDVPAQLMQVHYDGQTLPLGSVGAWADQSGNGNNANAPAPANNGTAVDVDFSNGRVIRALRVGDAGTFLQSDSDILLTVHNHYILIAQTSEIATGQTSTPVSFASALSNQANQGIWYQGANINIPKTKIFATNFSGSQRAVSLPSVHASDLTATPARATLDFFGVSTLCQIDLGFYRNTYMQFFERGVPVSTSKSIVGFDTANNRKAFFGVNTGPTPIYRPVHIYRFIALNQGAFVTDLSPLRAAIEKWLLGNPSSPYYRL